MTAMPLADDGKPKVDVVQLAEDILDPQTTYARLAQRDIAAMAQFIVHHEAIAKEAAAFMALLNRLGEKPTSINSRFDCMRRLIELEKLLTQSGYLEVRDDHSLSA